MKPKYLGKALGTMTPAQYYNDLMSRDWDQELAIGLIIKLWRPTMWEKIKAWLR